MKSLAGTLAAPFGCKPAAWRGLAIHGYIVSPDGDIWSLLSGRALRAYAIKDGYLGVALRHEGRTIRASVHGLVAEAFRGPRPPGSDVRHMDGDKTNNRETNIAYGTRAQNIADKMLHGTDQRGERNPSAKLTDAQAAEIRARRSAGEKLADIAADFGVALSCISRIATGKRRAVA